ncbi:hypothetical protein GALL_175460 [mine drainage metagenome]|uniref:DUF3108 domain-containing protein n=1 Tax=mine drainage metagenome TaxID=410659 RepID=A0A1J5RWH7_9ZZZZ
MNRMNPLRLPGPRSRTDAAPAERGARVRRALATLVAVLAAGASAGAATPATPLPAASAASADTEWQPSIDLRYALRGHYFIGLRGSGAFVWQHDGDRYRVALTGSSLVDFAYTSTGRIDGARLAPDRYVEQVLTRRKVVDFDRAAGVLRFTAISGTMPLPPRLQDSASVFMQLAHQLRTDPALFAAGRHMAFVVARPSGTTTWDFTVVGHDLVRTGAGELSCWHLRHAPSGGSLGAEVWLAPSLNDLPVQIRLEKDGGDYLLFTLREVHRP